MLELITGLSHWQICGLATWLLLQGTVVAVVPEEVIFLSLGVLCSQGKVAFPEALVSALAGLLPANSAMVFIASRFSQKKLVQKKSVQRALGLIKKRGPWVVFVTRFTPFLRAPVYISAGLSGMGVPRFFKIDIMAACIQVPALICLGIWIGEKTGSIMAAYKVIGIGALSLAAVALAVWVVLEWRGKKSERAPVLSSKVN